MGSHARTIMGRPRRHLLIVMAMATACLTPPLARASTSTDQADINARLKGCLAKHDDNAGMNACTNEAYKTADHLLTSVYNGEVARLKSGSKDDAETLKRLVKAERAWIAYRDADCDLEAATMLGGSGEGLAAITCMVTATQQRIKRLSDFLEETK